MAMRDRPPLIVVGVDGSAGSDAAKRWALTEARLRHATLRIVACFPPPVSEIVSPIGMPVAIVDTPTARRPYEELLDSSVAELSAEAPEVTIEPVLAEGPTVDELIGVSTDADLLVVGRSGRNQAVAVLLGSVCRAVLHKAHVPVVVVPAAAPTGPVEKMVVGVDGSPGSIAALDWAMAEAQRRGATLHVVHAWRYPYLGVRAGAAELVPLIHDDADHVLSEAVDYARSGGVAVVGHLVEQVESAGVLDIGREIGADLIVVGSRGRGGFSSLILGSVSTVVATHAPCAVAVVRPSVKS